MYISAYRRQQDGFGLITHMMEPKHPILRSDSNRKAPKEPVFIDYSSIYEFIDAYIDWCDDEIIRANRTYTDREKIDHVRDELDITFKTAKYKIKCKLDEMDTDPTKTFPHNLILNEKLGKYIVSLLPDNERSHINKIMVAPSINKTYDRNKKGKRTPTTMIRDESDSTTWAENLVWEIIPGARCPACHKNNHNVYKTGCPDLARFAACKAFYDKTPADQLKPIVRAYKKYQYELGKKMKDRRNQDRRMVRTLKHDYDTEDIEKIKTSLFHEYKTDYQENQYLQTNPLDDLDDEPDSDTEPDDDVSI
jgi:hypothetical protein